MDNTEEFLDRQEELAGIEQMFNTESIQEKLMEDAQLKANKILRKNKREINRLKTHAGECLINNNFAGYAYSIKKLRGYYKQPYNDVLIKQMWDTSRQTILDIVESNKAK